MTFYGGDYRPDDEPPPEAVLEEKRIMEHQFRRPSPSRWSSSTASSIRPPAVTRQGASRSLRGRGSGGSPRRSLQRSSAFGNRRSTSAITDRGRTASMPAVPIVRASRPFSNWRILITKFWLVVLLILDSDPVVLYRSKTEIGHELKNQKATVVSIIKRTMKLIIMIIQVFKSVEILNIFNDLKLIEKRLNIKGLRRHRWSRATSEVKLSAVVSEFGALAGLMRRTNGAYKGQLSLFVALCFSGTLVDVYLSCFHAMSTPWSKDFLGGASALNNVWRLCVVTGAAHYAVKQFVDNILRCSLILIQYNWMDTALRLN